jgi:hypothetical protein
MTMFVAASLRGMPMYARFVGAAPIRAGSHKEAIQQERLFSGGCAVFVDGAPAEETPVPDLISAVRAGRDVSGRIKAEDAGVEEVSFILVDEDDPELREILDEQEIR